jgi:hypothetical protein
MLAFAGRLRTKFSFLEECGCFKRPVRSFLKPENIRSALRCFLVRKIAPKFEGFCPALLAATGKRWQSSD